MKPKPDVSGSDLAAFVARGAQAQAAADGMLAPAERVVRVTKTIRIDRAIDIALKRAALERSIASGERVTEQDLIEQALRQAFLG
jgi:hypothetical protein